MRGEQSRRERSLMISHCRLPILDLMSARLRATNSNRQFEILNRDAAANGPVAQLVRACA
jgi:hypothetical protein